MPSTDWVRCPHCDTAMMRHQLDDASAHPPRCLIYKAVYPDRPVAVPAGAVYVPAKFRALCDGCAGQFRKREEVHSSSRDGLKWKPGFSDDAIFRVCCEDCSKGVTGVVQKLAALAPA